METQSPIENQTPLENKTPLASGGGPPMGFVLLNNKLINLNLALFVEVTPNTYPTTITVTFQGGIVYQVTAIQSSSANVANVIAQATGAMSL